MNLVVVGAGGVAQETRWLMGETTSGEVSPWNFAGYVVSDIESLGSRDDVDSVVGDLGWLDEHAAGIGGLVIGIGFPEPRRRLGEELSRRFPQLEWPNLVHPTALWDGSSATLGRGLLIYPGVVGTTNITLGDFTLVNSSCTIGHDAIVGVGCVINPGANISGGVVLGDGVLVGTGAQILQYVTVGDGATVGAGAVVTKDVEPGVTVVGTPARELDR